MYSKDHPFLATLEARYPLSAKESPKQTYHLTLNLQGSGLNYKVGDSFGIYPENEAEEVEKILKLLGFSGEEGVIDRKGEGHKLREFLLRKASLDTVTQKLFHALCENSNSLKINELKNDSDPSALKYYLEDHHVWDFLEENLAPLTPQQLADGLLPLMPRFYSVASSQSACPYGVDLAVADLEFTTNGHLRKGVCSRYMCHKVELNTDKIAVFHHPAHAFSLTQDIQAPLIMIGPGTGVAPFRGFMQERLLQGASHENWLFFGERHERENFYYQDYWRGLVESGHLRLTTAFSRDQSHKIYVQHRMKEEGREIFEWLERGAYLYVCGDAKRMAKDVESVLLEIIQEQGKEGKAYLKQLRQTHRYQRDVY